MTGFREYSVTLCLAIFGTIGIFFMLHITFAQVMESTNYKIQSDSINFGGGLTSSTNYTLESTGGELATGDSASTNFRLRAGYQQMGGSYIAIAGADPVTMSNVSGITGGEANGSTTVTVTTDSPAGYSLSIQSEASPAMVDGANSIADYVPVGVPDFVFTTDTSDAHFGYSPEGVDIVQRFLDDGAACNTGSGEVTLSCWDGLDMAGELIAQSNLPNHPDGATTTIRFRTGIGSAASQPEGVYSATTTLTALAL